MDEEGINIQTEYPQDGDTWGGLKKLDPNTAEVHRRMWKMNGILTNTSDPQEIAAASIGFVQAWIRVAKEERTRETIPPFEMVIQPKFLGDNNGLKPHDIEVFLRPTDDTITYRQLGIFVKEVNTTFIKNKPSP